MMATVSFSESDLTTYLEIALIELQLMPDEVGTSLDLSDAEIARLERQLREYMDPEA